MGTLNQTSASQMSDVLIELERRGVPRKAIAAAADVSVQYIGMCIAGEKRLTYEKCRLLMQRGGPVVASVVGEHFCERSPVRVSLEILADRTVLDANHDGIVDARDVIAHDLAALQQLTSVVQRACEKAENGKLSDAEKAKLRDALRDAQLKINMSRAALDVENGAPIKLAR